MSRNSRAPLESISLTWRNTPVPTQVSSHVMTVFYGMAEKIAESVLKDWEGKESKSAVRQKKKCWWQWEL